MSAGLAIDGVSHAFGPLVAVKDVTLSVGEGEIVALLGPSGCGKSTVLRLAAGLETLQTGRIRIDGATVAEPGREAPPEARSVGLMVQDFALFPHLTVRRNVAFGVRLPAFERDRLVEEAIARVDLAGRENDYPHALSGGEQQRVALARALAPGPKIMLLDEPFSGLDAVLRDRIRETAAAVLRASGTPTLMVTHDPEEAMLTADRIALMRAGRIIQQGDPDSLYRAPADAFCATFIGDVNELETSVAGGVAQTPIGGFKADGLPDGAPVTVLVRPEGLVLGADDGVPATVAEVRSAGRSAVVKLALKGGPALTARVFWSNQPRPGDTVRIRADHAMAFVFPSSDR